MVTALKTVGVVGVGQMGIGITQVLAQAGFAVKVADANLERAQNALKGLGAQLKKLEEKGKITADEVKKTLANITPVASIQDFKDVDFAIEAVSEKFELKAQIFKSLDENLPRHAILATNTSSISITKIAAVTGRPEKVVGMHFMNPVPLMKLVEGIRAIQTSEETYLKTSELCLALNKTLVMSRDIPGFIVNRILMPMINEAVYTLYEGIASVEEIDTAMKLGTNQPMGPLTLADFIGLDTCLAIMEVLHDGLGDSKYRPCPLLRQYVEAGWLGRKTKRGFYRYDI
jgi:3-hydroxybutyryl-CoA dehydrogenase